MAERTNIYITEDCAMVESHEEGNCSVCGRQGIRSDWPGSDPANGAALYLVLCHDEQGELVCDDCYDRLS